MFASSFKGNGRIINKIPFHVFKLLPLDMRTTRNDNRNL